MENICVFCGSGSGAGGSYADAARDLAKAIVEAGRGLVYGGASVGLMGILADEVLSLGGSVTGVIPQALVQREIAHRGLTRLEIVPSMHARKARMAELSAAFVALPGGYGTLDEFCEVLTWAQIGLHSKPMGLVNCGGYYDFLVRQFDHGRDEGFIRREHRQLLAVDASPAGLLEKLLART